MKRIYNFTFLLMLTALWACAQPQPTPAFVPPAPSVDISAYNWLHPELNMLQFYDRAALENLYENWQITHKKRLSVVLLGDSHLQTGHYPEQLSRRLRSLLGDGGWGLLFPNSTVETYSPMGYKAKHTGTWTPQRSITMRPKLPMGVRGMTCRATTLPAGFELSFAEAVPAEHTRLRIYCKKTDAAYDLEILAEGQKIAVVVDGSDPATPYVEVDIPALISKKITLNLLKKNPTESEFEFYGMSLETATNKGAILHNAGVGAARYNSILYQSDFKTQLPHFQPDLVVIDFGTNDYLYDDLIKPELESEIRKVIQTVRDASPKASILLTTAQDLFWKGVNCKSGAAFAELIHRIAADTKCGVYDWFWISGGAGTLRDWNTAGLAQKDMVHLTMSGYKLKGNLLFDAIKNTMDFMSKEPDNQKLIFPIDELKLKAPAPKPAPTPAPVISNTTTTDKKTLSYKVVAGDSLGAIARKYGVTVSQLVEWNKLSSPDKIYVGDTIIIRK